MKIKDSISSTRLHRLPMAIILAALTACGGATAPDVSNPVENHPDQPTGSPDDGSVGSGTADRSDCSTPNHLALTDIESVTDWINALPKPLELPCFLESLPRPLNLHVVGSIFSAQPSNGKSNPRIFILYDRLILSVVPQEAADPNSTEPPVNLLEMSFNTEGIKSIKAELGFPIDKALSYGEPYRRPLDTHLSISICGVCHSGERTVNEFDGVSVLESEMLRPHTALQVPLDFLKNESRYCDPAVQPHRCAMLSALVGEGDIFWQDFAADIPTL